MIEVCRETWLSSGNGSIFHDPELVRLEPLDDDEAL